MIHRPRRGAAAPRRMDGTSVIFACRRCGAKRRAQPENLRPKNGCPQTVGRQGSSLRRIHVCRVWPAHPAGQGEIFPRPGANKPNGALFVFHENAARHWNRHQGALCREMSEMTASAAPGDFSPRRIRHVPPRPRRAHERQNHRKKSRRLRTAAQDGSVFLRNVPAAVKLSQNISSGAVSSPARLGPRSRTRGESE